MGVDYYSCAVCDYNFPDCGEYYTCTHCEHMFCSKECAKLKHTYEGEEGYDEREANNYGSDSCTTCVLCRKETATDHQLLHALLEHFKISYDQAMEIYRKQED